MQCRLVVSRVAWAPHFGIADVLRLGEVGDCFVDDFGVDVIVCSASSGMDPLILPFNFNSIFVLYIRLLLVYLFPLLFRIMSLLEAYPTI